LTNFLKEYNQGVGQPTNKVPRLQVWDLLLQKIMLVKDTVDSFLNWKGSYIKSAHYLISKNANVKQIGDKLGHSPNNPVSAMHYLRFDKEESLENLRKFI